MCLYKSKKEIEEKLDSMSGIMIMMMIMNSSIYIVCICILYFPACLLKFSFSEERERERKKITTNLLTYYLFPISMWINMIYLCLDSIALISCARTHLSISYFLSLLFSYFRCLACFVFGLNDAYNLIIL